MVTAGTAPKRVSRLGGTKLVIVGSFDAPSSFSTPVSKSSTSNSSNRSWKTVQPSLSFYAIKVNAVSGQPGLIHSPQLVFDIHKDHPSGILTCKIPQDVVSPDHSFVVSSPCCSQCPHGSCSLAQCKRSVPRS